MIHSGEVPSRVDVATVIAEVRRTDQPFVFDTTKSDAPVFPLDEKFRRSKEKGPKGWQPGERLRTKFMVDQIRPHHGKKRANSVGLLDGTDHGDLYTFEGFSPEDKKALQSLGIAEIEATVEIEAPGIDNGHAPIVYKSKLVSIEGVTKPFDGDVSKLKRYKEEDKYNGNAKKTLIEGEVVKYVANKEYPYEGACVAVKVGDKVVTVKLPGGKTTIYSGDLGIFTPFHPVVGDKIQFNMIFGGVLPENGQLRDVSYEASHSHLLEASQDRREAYDAQRRKVAETIENISKKNIPIVVRNTVATLMEESFYQEDGHRDKVALTDSEKTALRAVISQQIHDQHEMPLDLFDSVYEAEYIRKGFEADIYQMSKSDYYAFCMRVARGELHKRGSSGASSLYNIMRNNLPESWQMDILQTSVDRLLPMVLNSTAQLAEGAHEENEETRQTQYLLREALRTLSDYPSVESVGSFTTVLDSLLDKKEQVFGKGEIDEFIRDYAYSVFNLIDNLTEKGEKKIIDVTNTEAMNHVIALLPKLQRLQEGIEKSYSRDEIDRTIKYIQAAGTFLYLRDVIGQESNETLA